MTQRLALVTGASQGIGEGIAKRLAKAGFQVAITSNDEVALFAVAEQITAMGVTCYPVVADVCRDDDVEHVVKSVFGRFGRIDALINNCGGIGRVAEFAELSLEEWSAVYDLNVLSGVRFVKSCLPLMQAQQWGRIVFLASELATEPGTLMPHYAASKAAVLSFSKSLANSIGRYNITVNSIAPGVIPTPSFANSAAAEGMSISDYVAHLNQQGKSVLPKELNGDVGDVANVVAFLCSDEARWVTGSNFRVDGGSVKSIQC